MRSSLIHLPSSNLYLTHRYLRVSLLKTLGWFRTRWHNRIRQVTNIQTSLMEATCFSTLFFSNTSKTNWKLPIFPRLRCPISNPTSTQGNTLTSMRLETRSLQSCLPIFHLLPPLTSSRLLRTINSLSQTYWMQPKCKWWQSSCNSSNLNPLLTRKLTNQLPSTLIRTIKSLMARQVKVLTSKAHRTFSISSTNLPNLWPKPQSRFRVLNLKSSCNPRKFHHLEIARTSRVYQTEGTRSTIRSSTTNINSSQSRTANLRLPHLTPRPTNEQAPPTDQAPMTTPSTVYLKGQGLLKRSNNIKRRSGWDWETWLVWVCLPRL